MKGTQSFKDGHFKYHTFVPSVHCNNLTEIDSGSSNFTFQVFPQRCTSCTSLLVTALDNPQWITVKCDHKLASSILCETSNHSHNVVEESKPNTQFCAQFLLLKNNTCYGFQWISAHMFAQLKCMKWMKNFQSVFAATASSTFPPILQSGSTIVSFKRLLNKHNYTKQKVTNNFMQGMCIRQEELSHFRLTVNVFKCADGAYISAQYVCDGTMDCPDDKPEDDMKCVCNKSNETRTRKTCKFVILHAEHQICSPLYHSSPNKTCSIFKLPNIRDSKAKIAKEDNDTFVCFNGTTISSELVNDLVSDCFPQGEDEEELKSVLVNKNFSFCHVPHQIPCREGHSKCFNISDICIYTLNSHHHLTPCRTGEHLHECETFECNVNFKCPGYYCIPWKYVCDGKWDCPDGTDEASFQNCVESRKCANLFKCRQHFVCIHLYEVCNDVHDCPHGDDEDLCTLKHVICAKDCQCLTFSIYCSSVVITFSALTQILPFLSIHISNSVVEIAPFWSRAWWLRITGCNLVEICQQISRDASLRLLNVASNKIEQLKSNCFVSTKLLEVVDIRGNLLSKLQQNTFADLLFLNCLNLSNNAFLELSSNSFHNLPQLKILSLLCVTNLDIDVYTFQDLQLDILETNRNELCCLVQGNVKCSENVPWYLPCSNLLMTTPLRNAFYFVSLGILLINLSSLMVQKISFTRGSHKTAAFLFLTTSVNVSDLSCSFPLMFLWIADLFFQETFVLSARKWKSSPICYTIFGLTLHFNVISPLVSCFLSFVRFKIVEYPLDSPFKEAKYVLKFIIGIVAFAFLLTVLATFLTWSVDSQVLQNGTPSVICSPFVDPTHQMITIVLVTWLTIVIQLMGLISITHNYVKLMFSLKKSQKKLKSSISKHHSSFPLYCQIAVVVTSNLLCWIPCGVIFLTAMFSEEYPFSMILWATILINPLNSFVYPAVFIITSARKLNASDIFKPPDKEMVESKHIISKRKTKTV